jgi:putative transposase
MTRAHKIRLNPTPDQVNYFMRAAGTARYAYNWAVEQWQHAQGQKPTAAQLKKAFNAVKPAWAYEVTKCAPEAAIFLDFSQAIKNYAEGRAKAPQFKKRSRGHFKFYLSNDQFDVRGYWLRVPKLGLVNMAEKLRFEGKLLSVKITREGKWWYGSITVELPDESVLPAEKDCGLDVGLLYLATLSDGTRFDNLKPLRNLLSRIARLQQLLARKVKGSNNYTRLNTKIAVLHQWVRNIRDDFLHKMTTCIAQEYGFVAVEDLKVKNLLKNHKLALAFSDAALGRLLAMLENKVTTHNGIFVKVDRFFPSSKRCFNCHHQRDDLTLAERTYVCTNPACGMSIDRDLNAALNIYEEGLRLAVEQSRPVVATTDEKSPSPGYDLDKHGPGIMSEHFCGSER